MGPAPAPGVLLPRPRGLGAWGLADLLSPQDTYFLSAEECITAGDFQNKHPNMCRLSPDGHFGSKFVTAVATGSQDCGAVHPLVPRHPHGQFPEAKRLREALS